MRKPTFLELLAFALAAGALLVALAAADRRPPAPGSRPFDAAVALVAEGAAVPPPPAVPPAPPPAVPAATPAKVAVAVTAELIERVFEGKRPRDKWDGYYHYELGTFLLANGFRAEAQGHFKKAVEGVRADHRETYKQSADAQIKNYDAGGKPW